MPLQVEGIVFGEGIILEIGRGWTVGRSAPLGQDALSSGLDSTWAQAAHVDHSTEARILQQIFWVFCDP